MVTCFVRDGTHFGYQYEALAVDYPNKPVEPFLLTLSPGDKDGQFQHGGQEFVYLLSSHLEFYRQDEKIRHAPGRFSLLRSPEQTLPARTRQKAGPLSLLFIEAEGASK